MNAHANTHTDSVTTFKTTVVTTSFVANVVVFATWLVYMLLMHPV